MDFWLAATDDRATGAEYRKETRSMHMNIRRAVSSTVALTLSLLAAPLAQAADVSNGTALRHSGQIHTHRGHHGSKKAASKAAPATTQDGGAQTDGQAAPR